MGAPMLAKLRANLAAHPQPRTPPRTEKIIVVGPFSETRTLGCYEFMHVVPERYPPGNPRAGKVKVDDKYDVKVLSNERGNKKVELWDVTGPVHHGMRCGYLTGATEIIIAVPEQETHEKTAELMRAYENEVLRENPRGVHVSKVWVKRDDTPEAITTALSFITGLRDD